MFNGILDFFSVDHPKICLAEPPEEIALINFHNSGLAKNFVETGIKSQPFSSKTMQCIAFTAGKGRVDKYLITSQFSQYNLQLNYLNSLIGERCR